MIIVEEEKSMKQMMIQSIDKIQFKALSEIFINYPIKIED